MLLLVVLACGKNGKNGTDDTSGGGSDLIENVTAELTDINTVVRVTFDTTEEATATVMFGPEDLRYETPPTEKGTHHEVLLVGLPALTTAHYQIVVGDETGQERTIETGPVDPLFQPLILSGGGHDRFAGMAMLGGKLGAGVAILDPEGRYVWNYIDDSGLYVYRMRPLKDGSGVGYNVANVSGDRAITGTGLVKVPFDGSEQTMVSLEYFAHDWVDHADGTVAAIAFKPGPLPEECPDVYAKAVKKDGKKELLGNHIVEIAPDGTQTEVWDSWDCFDPCTDISNTLESGTEPGWTFANALDYDEDTDSYLVSMRHLSTIASVSRATGQCNWIFGSTPSATIEPTGKVFWNQHQFQWWPGHLLVFDNDGLGSPLKGDDGVDESRVLEYALDPAKPTAEVIWEHRLGVYSPVLGDVQRLENGDTMIVASLSGQIARVTADGETTWKANTTSGTVFGFGGHYTSPYEPSSAPD
jgi:hypothetical protein